MPFWEAKDEDIMVAAASEPMPCDTPSRLPSHSYEYLNQHQSSSPSFSSSPLRMHEDDMVRQRDVRDASNDDSISVLDPRRFTPTLHASLVSEILNLRRGQEESAKAIQLLESTLHESQEDAERLADTLSSNSKETRSLKRQLALLEGGTSSVLDELTTARDKAAEGMIEVKMRLDAAQKRIRALDDDSKKVHEQWARDKDSWQEERRKYERKIHSSEARMRGILEEVAAFQAEQPPAREFKRDAEADNQSHDSGLGYGSDTASMKSTSMTNTTHSVELDAALARGMYKPHGISLADELDLSDEDGEIGDDPQVLEDDSRSMQSASNAAFHDVEDAGPEVPRKPTSQTASRYVSVEVQCSLPPLQPATDPVTTVSPLHVVAMTRLPAISSAGSLGKTSDTPQLWARSEHSTVMTSTLSQTMELPLSPPLSPRSPLRPPPAPPTSHSGHMDIVESSTRNESSSISSSQCEVVAEIAPSIPSIAVHPPSSRPATPRAALLQQHVKDFGCQVSLQKRILRSVSVQTEEILVDRRLHKLPAHLQPSFIRSNPSSPKALKVKRLSRNGSHWNLDGVNESGKDDKHDKDNEVAPSSLPSRPNGVSDVPNRSNAEVLPSGAIQRQCPKRISSLFAGFEDASSDEADEFVEIDWSDNDCSTALSAPRPRSAVMKHSTNAAMTAGSASKIQLPGGKGRSASDRSAPQTMTGRAKPVWIEGANLIEESEASLPTKPRSRQGAARRSMLITNGIVAHHARSRSPSLPNLVVKPPFPIPTRASSRQPSSGEGVSNDNDVSLPPRGDPWSAAKEGSDRYHHHINSLRKVRSAAALSIDPLRSHKYTNGSPSLGSVQKDVLVNPRLPSLPIDYRTSSQSTKLALSTPPRIAERRDRVSPNAPRDFATDEQPQVDSDHQNHVVDAIAQTMVGEWMFKYVRRGKSFGMADSSTVVDGEVAANGARHKRWVWLAPYERAVMWSSKQPTSGSALLGKSGRKLPIQSVLDVKDDNPPPKGVSAVFTRSILILTPGRALKITASSRERHYVWLSALSFLAHSNQELPSLDRMLQATESLPAALWSNPDHEPISQIRGKRKSIRESIRIAKGKGAALYTPPMALPLPKAGPECIDDILDCASKDSFHDPVSPGPAHAPVVPRFTERDYSGSYGRYRSQTASRAVPQVSSRGLPVRGPRSVGGASYSTSNSAGIEPSSIRIPTLSSAEMRSTTYTSSNSRNHSSQVSRTQSRGHETTAWDELGTSSPHTASSTQASEVADRRSRRTSNFFDAVGTMRMEAFITPTTDQFDDFLQQQYGGAADRGEAQHEFEGMHGRTGLGNSGGFDDLRAWR